MPDLFFLSFPGFQKAFLYGIEIVGRVDSEFLLIILANDSVNLEATPGLRSSNLGSGLNL